MGNTQEDAMGAVATIEPAEVAPIQNTASVLDMIVRAATNPDIDVDKMERLMAMHDKIVERQAMQEFNDAMSEAQAEMRMVAVDSDNPQTKSKYASYAAVDRELRPIYTKHGFSLSFDSGKAELPEHIRVICFCGHRGGYTRQYHVEMPADGKGAKGGDVMTKTHAAGAAFAYGKRYLAQMIFNLATGENDNDGNGASITPEQKAQLIEKMKAVKADTVSFLKYLGVANLDVLPATQFGKALTALAAKERALKKEPTDA